MTDLSQAAEVLLSALEQAAGFGQQRVYDFGVDIASLGRPRPRRRPATSTPCVWSLPHHGAELEECGLWCHMAHVAGADGLHVRPYRRDCARYECPSCRCVFGDDGQLVTARGWEAREARAISNRILEAFLSRHERGRPIHVVVSPPQAAAAVAIGTIEGFRRLRSAAYRVAKKAGLRGAAWAFHHQRLPSQFNQRAECADGPHFHAIGFGWIEGTRDLYERSGWIVKNLGVRESVYGTALYVLSHASRATAAQSSNDLDLHRGLGPERLVDCLEGLLNHVGNAVADGQTTEHHLSTDPLGRPNQDHTFLVGGIPTAGKPAVVTWSGSLSYNALERLADVAGDETSYRCSVCDRDVPRGDWFEVDIPESKHPPDPAKCFVIEAGVNVYWWPAGGRWGKAESWL